LTQGIGGTVTAPTGLKAIESKRSRLAGWPAAVQVGSA